LFNKHSLALELHCPVYEIDQMPAGEFDGWMAYFRIAEERRNQSQKSKSKRKR